MEINQILAKAWKAGKRLGSGDQDYWVMYSVARAIQATRIVEIGTHRGYSAIVFCQAVIDNGRIPRVWTLDNWSQADVHKYAKKLIDEVGFTRSIKMVEGDSRVTLRPLLEKIGKVDLIFIDGSHLPEDVRTDFRNAAPYTNYVLLHDTGKGNVPYLQAIRADGWTTISLPTRYCEGDNHLVGITLAKKQT